MTDKNIRIKIYRPRKIALVLLVIMAFAYYKQGMPPGTELYYAIGAMLVLAGLVV